MPFNLTTSERKLLELLNKQDVPYIDETPRKHGGRGASKTQKTGTLQDMLETKIERGFSNVAGFSQYLDSIGRDKSKYAAAILEAYANAKNYSAVLNNVFRSDKIAEDKKLEIAEVLLTISSDHIIGTMKDEIQKKAITAPLETLKKDLSLIIASNRKNALTLADNALMDKRQQHISRLKDLRSDLYVYNVACNLCTATWRGSKLDDALLGVKHEEECPYVNDKQTVEANRDPKINLPLRPIFDHYTIKLPLKRVVVKNPDDPTDKDGKEITLAFMPDDYKKYVLTESEEKD